MYNAQDVFATPGSPGSAHLRSSSKSGTASKRMRSPGKSSAPTSTAEKGDERRSASARKRAAPASADKADDEGAKSGDRAKRSRLAPADEDGERKPNAVAKRPAGASMDSDDDKGANSGATARRSRLAPINTVGNEDDKDSKAVPEHEATPAPGSPAAHTRSHDQVCAWTEWHFRDSCLGHFEDCTRASKQLMPSLCLQKRGPHALFMAMGEAWLCNVLL